MSHLDEGQLAALLDNELDPAERREVESHLAACAECRAVWEETRAFASEADRLVGTIELPPRVAPPISPPRLAPDGSAVQPRTRLPWRTFAWAASVAVALGLGYSLRSVSRYAVGSPVADKVASTEGVASAAAKTTNPPLLDSQAMAARGERSAGPAPAAAPLAVSRPAPQARPAAAGAVAEPPSAPAEEARNEAEKSTLAQAGKPARDAAPLPTTPTAALHLRDADSGTDRRTDSDELTAKQGSPQPGAAGLRPVEMESAVRTLAGSIRLLDGLQPTRVLTGPGRAFPGGDPVLEGIRVVYLDPPGRELWLDQQRMRPESEALLAQRATGLLPGDTILVAGNDGTRSLRWIDQDGFRLALTGFLSADSLWALLPRVR